MLIRRLGHQLVRRLAVRANVHAQRDLHVGWGSVIWAPESLTIGRAGYIGKGVTIEVDGQIGDGVLIANRVGLVGRTDHDHHQVGEIISRANWVGEFDYLRQQLLIGSDVWIGYGATVLSGVRVGDSTIVAAGAVVTDDVPPNSVVVGIPARVVGTRFTDDEYRDHWERLAAKGFHKVCP